MSAAQYAMGTSTEIIADCKAVVDTWQQPWKRRLHVRSRSAGMCRHALGFPSLPRLVGCRHVHSHRALESAKGQQDAQDIIHNDFVDARACDSGAIHAWEAAENIAKAVTSARDIAIGMAQLLAAHFEPVRLEGLSRMPRTVLPAKVTFAHDWQRQPSSRMFVCSVCGLASHARAASPCFGQFRSKSGFGPGHRVCSVWLGQVRFNFCRICGGHGSWRVQLLTGPCRGPPKTAPQRWVLKQLLSAKHPRTKEQLLPERPVLV